MTLLEAIHAGDSAAASKSLRGGADANELGEGGETPLMAAASAGWPDLVKALLAAGAEPSLTDGGGETALLRAAAGGHRKVVELLLPHASQDDRDMARAYLDAAGRSDGPPSEGPGKLKTSLV